MDPMAIHRAAKEGDLHRLGQLIEAGVSVDSRDDKGRTPLELAAQWGHHAVVEFLINCNCELDPEYRMSLDIDVEKDCYVGLFFKDDENNYTLLHFASAYGWADIAKAIIGKGSQSDMVNAALGGGSTPLMQTARDGHEDVAALLLRSGADVNRRDKSGYTALHHVAQNGHDGMVKLLLQEKGLDLIPQDLEGATPLHLACYFPEDEEVIKQLLIAGADVNLINRHNDTPLTIYLQGGVESDPSLEVINLFLQRCAFFQDRGYLLIWRNPVLKDNVLKNVGLCTQSVINKFNYHTLPALYSSPYFASMLPSMDNFMLKTSQKDEVQNFVRRDIQRNTFCNVVKVRPTALSALCIQCLATYITSRK